METFDSSMNLVSNFNLDLIRLLGNNFYGLSSSNEEFIVFIKPKTPKNNIDSIPSEFNGKKIKIIKSVPILPLIT